MSYPKNTPAKIVDLALYLDAQVRRTPYRYIQTSDGRDRPGHIYAIICPSGRQITIKHRRYCAAPQKAWEVYDTMSGRTVYHRRLSYVQIYDF